MKRKLRLSQRLLRSFLIVTLFAGSSFSAAPGDYAENGVFLAYGYCNSDVYVGLVRDLGRRMTQHYKAPLWYPNVGFLNAQGKVGDPGRKTGAFLNEVRAFESSSGKRLTVMAWINGSSAGTDIGAEAVRANVVREALKFLSTTDAGGYVYAAQRSFDGVLLDIEPMGDPAFVDEYKTLVDALRLAMRNAGLADKKIGIAAHKYGTTPPWRCGPVFFYYMARRVDMVVANTYNSSSVGSPAYRDWMRQQTKDILRAVSGRSFNDSTHPAPTNGVKVYMGFPAYPAGGTHDPAAETIAAAAQGVLDGLNELERAGDPSKSLLGGSVVFQHTDGVSGEGYARYSTEWWWWGRYWLGIW